MNTVTITANPSDQPSAAFRAVSGDIHSVGRTVGEALDALLAQSPNGDDSSVVLIQRFRPDEYFTAEQIDRIHMLNRGGSRMDAESVE